MLHLERINHKNVWDAVDLKVFRLQKDFVSPNWASIVEAYSVNDTDTSAFPFVIYNDKKPVGFLMIGFNESDADRDTEEGFEPPKAYDHNYTIWRLMIDKKYQKRGYGRQAINLALNFIRTWPCGKAEYCAVSYEPENEVARKLYYSMGFEENGEMDGDEIVAALKL